MTSLRTPARLQAALCSRLLAGPQLRGTGDLRAGH